jgi:hypothetical protein
MFHDEIPYAVAQERGAIQQKLLEELTAEANALEEVNLENAVAEVEKRIPPLH